MMLFLYIAGGLSILGLFVWDVWFHVNYELVANISLTVFAATTTVFVLLYGLRSRWWTNVVGRVFFTKAVILPLVLWQIVLSVWFNSHYPGREQVRFVIYTMAPVAYVVMVAVLWREQRGDRARRGGLRDVDDDAVL